MNRYPRLVLALAGVIVLLGQPGVTHANNGLRTVALSGQAAPGTSTGVKFSTFTAPVINDRGETAFVGAISGTGVSQGTNSDGIWSEGGGGLNLLARAGSAAPGAPSGAVFRFVQQLEGPVINDAGQTAFAATISGPGITSANNAGIWSTATGNVALEMRTGDAAPGTASQFASIGDGFSSAGVGLLLNNNGKIGFQATLTPPANMGQGIWSGGGGSPLSLIARSGTPAPGAGANFTSIASPNGPVMNNLGQVAFSADTAGLSGVWSERGGNGLQRVAKTGDSAPGTAPGVVFSYFAYHPGQNDAGNIGFYAGLSGPGITSSNDEGLWSDSGGTLHLVAREGSPAPGAGYPFAGPFYERVMNEKGEMAFVSTSGIWSEGGGHGLRPVALFAQPIPGAPSVLFDGLDVPNAPALNRLGQTAFIAPLVVFGGGGGSPAIFAEDILGQLHMVVRVGDIIDVSNDPQVPMLRTVSTLQFVGQSGNNDGRRSGLNDWGQVAFYATFTDRSAGVFVSNVVAVPEPGGVALAVLGAMLVGGRRHS